MEFPRNFHAFSRRFHVVPRKVGYIGSGFKQFHIISIRFYTTT